MKKTLKPISIFILALILVLSSFMQERVYADEISESEETVEHTANIDKTLKLNITDCTLYFKQEQKSKYNIELTDYSTKLTLRVFNNTSSVVKFSSTNKKVATVSTDGIVTAVGTGDCKIKVKVGKKTLTCNIKVEKMPSAKTALKKVTATCKLVDNHVIVTAKNKLPLPVCVIVYYDKYTTSGSKTSDSIEIFVLPGKTTKELEAIKDDSVVKIEKTGIKITAAGSSYLLASDAQNNYSAYSKGNLMSRVDTAEFYMDSVGTRQSWWGDYITFNYTVVNNEPYDIDGNVYIVFYKDKKIINCTKVVEESSKYVNRNYQPGITQKSFEISAFEYDSYKIINNGFFQHTR